MWDPPIHSLSLRDVASCPPPFGAQPPHWPEFNLTIHPLQGPTFSLVLGPFSKDEGSPNPPPTRPSVLASTPPYVHPFGAQLPYSLYSTRSTLHGQNVYTPCDVSQSIPLLLLIPTSTKGLINKFLSSINFPNAFFLDHST